MMDAPRFMALLRASNPVWHENDGDPPRWVFRGHRNVAWRLKPQAWRSVTEGNPLHAMIRKLANAEVRDNDKTKPGTNRHQALTWTHAEKLVLNEFRRIGWHTGFDVDEPVSGYSMDLNYGPVVVEDTQEEPDIYSPFLSCTDIGVAQHHGVPTRFLDWTFNPIFAVFFAQENGPDQTDLCVWAMDTNAINSMYHWEGGIGRTLMRPLVPRRRGNDFILAQDGLLLEIEHKWHSTFSNEMAHGRL